MSGRPPSYYIVAGFVLTVVSVPYLRSEYGKDYEFEAPVKLLDKLRHAMAESVDEQLAVVSQVLVSDISIGYEDIVNTRVGSGKPVKKLKNLTNMVESCNDEYRWFDLDYQQVVSSYLPILLQCGQIVVLRTTTAEAAASEILAIHRIPFAMSNDLET